MSKMYEKVKSYYDTGLWSEERVRNMVVKGVITEEEYASIVGKEYEEQIILLSYSTSLVSYQVSFYMIWYSPITIWISMWRILKIMY